jgi:REP element-mobilizing transposase RayT
MDPDLEQKIKAAKNKAALAAFETYRNHLMEALKELNVNLVEALDGTAHVHSAIIVSEKDAVLSFCRWDFTADQQLVDRALQESHNIS